MLFWRGPRGQPGWTFFSLKLQLFSVRWQRAAGVGVSYGAWMERANHKFVSRISTDLRGGRWRRTDTWGSKAVPVCLSTCLSATVSASTCLSFYACLCLILKIFALLYFLSVLFIFYRLSLNCLVYQYSCCLYNVCSCITFRPSVSVCVPKFLYFSSMS